MKPRLKLFRLFVVCALCLPLIHCPIATADANKTAPAVSSPQETPFYRNWRLVAESDMIVQGKLRVPVASLRAKAKARQGEYIALQLDVSHVLKGTSKAKTLTIVRTFELGGIELGRECIVLTADEHRFVQMRVDGSGHGSQSPGADIFLKILGHQWLRHADEGVWT